MKTLCFHRDFAREFELSKAVKVKSTISGIFRDGDD